MKKMKFLQHCLSLRFLRVLILVPLVGGGAMVTDAATFSTALTDIEWRVKGSVFECSLSHPVGGYGAAMFTRRAGEAEMFRLQSDQLALTPGTALIQALWPS